jgi:hypothetical protein
VKERGEENFIFEQSALDLGKGFKVFILVKCKALFGQFGIGNHFRNEKEIAIALPKSCAIIFVP